MSVVTRSISIREFYTVFRCPAKQLIKHLGYKLPSHASTRPKISPTELGKLGEKIVFEGISGSLQFELPKKALEYVKQEEYSVEEVSADNYIKYLFKSKKKIRDQLKTLYEDLRRLKLAASNITTRRIVLEDPFVEEIKKKYHLSEVIPKVNVYNVAHHYEGQLDFLGITKSGETKIIEVKNTSKLNVDEALMQISLYLHGMNKRYLANTSDIFESTTSLRKYLSSLYAPNSPEFTTKPNVARVNFWSYIVNKIYDIDPSLIENYLKETYFYTLYLKVDTPEKMLFDELKSIERAFEDEIYCHIIHFEDIVKKYRTKLEDFFKFLNKETAYKQIKQMIPRNMYDAIEPIKPALREIMNEVQSVLDITPDSGIIINIRKKDLREITEPITDIDELAKIVWDIKRRAFVNDVSAIKNRSACRYCNLRIYCDKITETDDFLRDIKSAIVLVDRGVDNVLKQQKNREIDLTSVRNAYMTLIKETSFVPRDAIQWKNVSNLISHTPSYRKYYITKRARKFRKEIKFWY